jgi:hypothetical protein
MGNQLPAGWYVDPSDAHQYRWWTGDRWTTDTQDKTAVDIAAAEAATRPLPDFDADEEGATGVSDGRRRIPVLLAVALLVGMVATAGVVAVRPDPADGHQLTGEIRVATDDVAGWTRRADRFLGDGAPCGEGETPGVGAGTKVTVSSARGDVLGEVSLGMGEVDRTLNSTSCVFPYAVDGLDEARIYLVQVGDHDPRRAKFAAVESAGWILDLRLS